MKCLITLLVPFLLFTQKTFAQGNFVEDSVDTVYEEENETLDYSRQGAFRILDSPVVSLGLSAATMPFVRQQAFGVGMDLQVGYTGNLSAGISLAIMGRKVDPKFGYQIGESRLTYYELSLFNELKLLQLNRFSASLRLSGGYAAFHLADNSIKETYTWYDEYGNAYEGERATPIAANRLFKLAPGLQLRYQFAYHAYIEGGATYNWYIGDLNYGRHSDFNNYMLQLGFKFDINF